MPYFLLGGTPAIAIAACGSFIVVSDHHSPDEGQTSTRRARKFMSFVTLHDEGVVGVAYVLSPVSFYVK